MSLQTGAPNTQFNVFDASGSQATGILGLAAMIGPTERGVVGRPYLIQSDAEFTRKLGGYGDGSEEHAPIRAFRTQCMRALMPHIQGDSIPRKGAPLLVFPAGHYGDPTDASTLGDGCTKATVTIAQDAVEGTPVVLTIPYTLGNTGRTHAFYTLDAEGNQTAVGTPYLQLVGDTIGQLQAAVVTALGTPYSGIGGVSVSPSNNGTDTITLSIVPSAPVFEINGLGLKIEISGGVGANVQDEGYFAGAFPATELVANGQEFGRGYNQVGLRLTQPPNRFGQITLEVFLPGNSTPAETYALPLVYTEADIQRVNAASYLVELEYDAANAATGFPRTAPTIERLTGGDFEVQTLLSEEDYIGDQTAKTGLWAFSKDQRPYRVLAPAIASPAVDNALIEYAKAVRIQRAHIRTPLGVGGSGAIAYREGQTPYVRVDQDTIYGSLYTGGLSVIHPLTNAQEQIPELGDVVRNKGSRDQAFEFVGRAMGGWETGRCADALDVVVNFFGVSEGNEIDAAGIIPVVNHPTLGVVFWGNSSLYKTRTKLASDHICDLFIDLLRRIQPFYDKKIIAANDPANWKAIHNLVAPVLRQYDTAGAIEAFRDTTGTRRPAFIYVGDQEADTIADAKFNTPEELQNDQYHVQILLAPKGIMKYIIVDLVATSQSTNFSLLLPA